MDATLLNLSYINHQPSDTEHTNVMELWKFRLNNGMCPHCGNKVYEKKGLVGFKKWVALNIPKLVSNGICISTNCKPDNRINSAYVNMDGSNDNATIPNEIDSVMKTNQVNQQPVSTYSGASFQIVVNSTIVKPVVAKNNDTEMTKYVLNNGDQYGIKLCNKGDQIVKAYLKIDGQDMGTFIIKPNVNYQEILRPVSIDKKFTFYTVRAVRKAQNMSNPNAGAKAVAMSGIERTNELDDHLNGLIQCDFIPGCEWKIIVKSESTGQIFPFSFNPSETVSNLKDIIHPVVGVPALWQVLLFADEVLTNDKRLIDYKIKHGDKLRLVEWTIKVKSESTGQIFPFSFNPSETVSNLKDRIQPVVGVPAVWQVLLFADEVLTNGKKLIDYKIKNGDILRLGKPYEYFLSGSAVETTCRRPTTGCVIPTDGYVIPTTGCVMPTVGCVRPSSACVRPTTGRVIKRLGCVGPSDLGHFGSTGQGSVDPAIQGATTLQGKSGQKFKSVDLNLFWDETKKVTIYARLVGIDEVNPTYHNDTATALRSVPPPPAPI